MFMKCIDPYTTILYSKIGVDKDTVSVMFIYLTLTNVESRMSRDFFPWILRGISVDFARVLRGSSVSFAWSLDMKRGTA